ncbi:nanos 4 [Oopsacas minuta]|uniref:Nanos 4 n=1 Tax=Oopsacas minuta TaxID=111878 RepID=A0A1W5RS66_9METZ|nr:nanos 4 [Oopsacas minuta]KAI6652645.1 nanos 4 [Oopsacas minuta]
MEPSFSPPPPATPQVFSPPPIREFNVSFTQPLSPATTQQSPVSPCEAPYTPVASPNIFSTIDFNLSIQRQRAALNRDRYKKVRFCVFCQSSKQPEQVYRSHILKDQQGRVVCPFLRSYTCPLCCANGDDAHTIKYCPLRQPTIVFT